MCYRRLQPIFCLSNAVKLRWWHTLKTRSDHTVALCIMLQINWAAAKSDSAKVTILQAPPSVIVNEHNPLLRANYEMIPA